MSTKLIITGSRTFTDFYLLDQCIADITQDEHFTVYPVSQIISGGSKGVDALAKMYAIKYGLPYHEFRPRYYNPRDNYAIAKRNRHMAEYGDILVVIWDGVSRTMNHLITCMQDLDKVVYTYIIGPPPPAPLTPPTPDEQP